MGSLGISGSGAGTGAAGDESADARALRRARTGGPGGALARNRFYGGGRRAAKNAATEQQLKCWWRKLTTSLGRRKRHGKDSSPFQLLFLGRVLDFGEPDELEVARRREEKINPGLQHVA